MDSGEKTLSNRATFLTAEEIAHIKSLRYSRPFIARDICQEYRISGRRLQEIWKNGVDRPQWRFEAVELRPANIIKTKDPAERFATALAALNRAKQEEEVVYSRTNTATYSGSEYSYYTDED